MNKYVILLLSAALIIQSSFLLASCENGPKMQTITLNGEQIKASPNQPISVTYTEVIGTNTITGGGSSQAKGAGITTKGDIQGFNSTLPNVSLTDIGGSSTYAKISQKLTNPATIFFVLSAVSLVAAIPVLIYISKKAGILLFAVSGTLLAAGLFATYAPILFAIAIVISLAIIGIMYADKSWMDKVWTAFKSVVGKIEEAPPEVQEPLKAKIKEVDNGSIKEVVTEIKKELP